NQHGPLLRGQELDRDDECERDGFARNEVFEHPVGIGLQMFEVLTQLGGPRAPSRDGGEADVRGDGVQPGSELRAWLVTIRAFPRAQHRLLECVVRVVERAAHPVTVAMAWPPGGLDQDTGAPRL